MAYEFKFPFEPPWEDLKLTLDLPNGGKAYVFDTCVVRDPVKRAAIDEEVGMILARAERKRFLKRLREKGIQEQ